MNNGDNAIGKIGLSIIAVDAGLGMQSYKFYNLLIVGAMVNQSVIDIFSNTAQFLPSNSIMIGLSRMTIFQGGMGGLSGFQFDLVNNIGSITPNQNYNNLTFDSFISYMVAC